MKNILTGLCVVLIILGYGYWKGATSRLKDGCEANMQTYKEVVVRMLGISSNTEPKNQIKFNSDLDNVNYQLASCSETHQLELASLGRTYIKALDSIAIDAFTALELSSQSNSKVDVKISQETRDLFEKLKAQEVPKEFLDPLLSLEQIFETTFSEYHNLSEQKRSVIHWRAESILIDTRRKTKDAYDRLFNDFNS